ncbi:MAG: hypothetical protein Ct9H300mP7_2660 [Verrucomicrobiota bacterium]|nr:MAG: hypothetical protein Ct9H300mP7_2660 [Verrucomicrobiota bacterium]
MRAVGKAKREFTPRVVEPDVKEEAEEISQAVSLMLAYSGQVGARGCVNALKDEMEEKLIEKFGEKTSQASLSGGVLQHSKSCRAQLVLDDGKRLDGRGLMTCANSSGARHDPPHPRFGSFCPW